MNYVIKHIERHQSAVVLWAAWVVIVQLTVRATFPTMTFIYLAPLVFSPSLNRQLCALIIIGLLFVALIFLLTHHPIKADAAITLAYYFFLIGIVKVLCESEH